MHAAVRLYDGNAKLMDVLEERAGEVERIIRGVPGFVSYYLARTSEGGFSVSVFESPGGTRASSRLAAEWIKDNAPDAAGDPPRIIEGEPFMHLDA